MTTDTDSTRCMKTTSREGRHHMFARAIAFSRIQGLLSTLTEIDQALAGVHGLSPTMMRAVHKHLVEAGNACELALQVVATDEIKNDAEEPR